jgi:NitT/TauT family transport system permease protein
VSADGLFLHVPFPRRGLRLMKRLINFKPPRLPALMLALAPFVIVFFVYVAASNARLELNPNDKLLPAMTSFGSAIQRMGFEVDPRSGAVLLWLDTASSLQRLGIAMGISAAIGLVFGIALGAIPVFSATFSSFVASLSLIPPMAILPILFICFGLGELAKVVLMVIGIAPVIARDLQGRVLEIPRELLIKAQTLGASSWQIVLRVILPLVLPRLLEAARLSLGSAWLFLIAAEAIAATDGLGYRIFLVRRFLAMDVILPYVVWITLLAYAFDRLLALVGRLAFPWHYQEKRV